MKRVDLASLSESLWLITRIPYEWLESRALLSFLQERINAPNLLIAERFPLLVLEINHVEE